MARTVQVPTKEYEEMNRASDFTKNVTGTLQVTQAAKVELAEDETRVRVTLTLPVWRRISLGCYVCLCCYRHREAIKGGQKLVSGS